MITRSWSHADGTDAHRAIVAVGLAIIALVAFGSGATVFTTAPTSTAASAVGVGYLLVALAALAWLASILTSTRE